MISSSFKVFITIIILIATSAGEVIFKNQSKNDKVREAEV